MSDDFARICLALPKLKPDQLLQLRARIGALLPAGASAGAPARGKATGEADDALAILSEVANAAGAELTSAGQLRKTVEWPPFRDTKAPDVWKWLRGQTNNKTELETIARACVRLMIHEMRDIGIPVSSRYLMRTFHRLPSIVEANFPGYAGRGHLKLIISSLHDRKQKGVLEHVRKKSSN